MTSDAPIADALSNPILNQPYDAPTRYFEMGPHGPTGVIKEGRRPSESLVPIAASRKGTRKADGSVEVTLDVELTAERRERNTLINDLRREIERWRLHDYERVTPTSRKLLQHWADPTRENRVLYCQREAVETAIFLAEVAGRHGYADWRRRVDEANADHNNGLPRVALKMATGTGKTVVMAMLIAWQTANKVASPRDARFTKRFLVVTPGITIRDRLQVLRPTDRESYYKKFELLPPDLVGTIAQAQIAITNYHAFLPRDAKELDGVSATTRKILTAGLADDPFRETPDAMVARVLRDIGDRTEPVLMLSDEAHHCYQDKPLPQEVGRPKLTREQEEANAEARVWFRGIQAVARKAGVKTIYDLSATPYYLSGSGYNEGYIFPWTVSDFSLMDAIEAGVVKIPRTPIDDDAAGDVVTYLRLWDFVGNELPKKSASKTIGVEGWIPPKELQGALDSLYRSYRRAFEHWERELAALDEPPPVFIVVCPNTVVSKLVYDWIAGGALAGTTAYRSGELPLLSNIVDGQPLTRPVTILIDSARLESGEALTKDFRDVAAGEIEAFKQHLRSRTPGADVDEVSDEDLLREVMNTVGKKGKLGEGVRCVVSVAMLTEGWDANTVTHILGLRAFGSQLLCEQVVGRGLRRRSYALNDDGYFEPEYANIYGVPFQFIPTDRALKDTLPPPPAVLVESLPDREHLRITFPKLDGYRVEVPDDEVVGDLDDAPRFPVGQSTVPTRTDIAGIVGTEETEAEDGTQARAQQVAYALARQLLRSSTLTGLNGDTRPWLFPRLVQISRDWLDRCVDLAPGYSLAHILRYAELRATAVEAIHQALVVHVGNRRERLRPMIRRHDPTGSTANVSFATRKAVEPTEKSEVNYVTLDGRGGNTWEQLLANACERDDDVAAYAKNDRLGFTIPYVHEGRAYSYVPDFLVRLKRKPYEPFDRTLIVEVSGSQKSPGPTTAKAETARNQWCVAVNNHGGFGRWGYVEIRDMVGVREQLANAIGALYDDSPIIGDSDLLDFDIRDRETRAAS
jgi:type III restriction enzyme